MAIKYLGAIILGCLFFTDNPGRAAILEAECFSRVEEVITNHRNMDSFMSGEMSRLDEVIVAMGQAYSDNKLKYLPLFDNLSIVYGGTCEQVNAWNKKLSREFKITNVEENVYDILFAKALGYKVD